MSVKLRKRKLAKGATKFYLDIYQNGERFYEFLDFRIESTDTKSVKEDKIKLANVIRSQRELDIISSNNKFIPKYKKNVNFFDFAEAFILNYKKKDVRMIQATLNQFKKFIENPKLRLTDINHSIMLKYMDYLNDVSGLTGVTPHNYFTRFKKILKEAEIQGLITENPASKIKFQKKGNPDELKKQVLTTDEIQTLANTPCGNNELKRAFLFACYTGLGYAEIKKLKWANIANNRLTTRREKTDQKVDIKLKDSLLNLLGKKSRKEDFIFDFIGENGNTISDNGINKCLKNWVNRAEIDKHITFYCARHTFATQLLQYGANLKTVADALGHSNTRNTIKYLNYIDNLKDDAVDNLPSLNI
ncbi:tyrosine-type recombinase/integrase [Formosa sp. S-31]|uniref:tyrosine-type recombinase/integrase n=1 Tax=Formosa sp. S-31 TaxID=2790949 RepID=UPI003EBDBE83